MGRIERLLPGETRWALIRTGQVRLSADGITLTTDRSTEVSPSLVRFAGPGAAILFLIYVALNLIARELHADYFSKKT